MMATLFTHFTPMSTDLFIGKKITQKTAFVVGHEENGLSFSPNNYDKVIPIAIEQFGKTESLNVAVAASICLYEYSKQHEIKVN